jgi:hypothetical protein
MEQIAVLNVEKGEVIVAALVGGHVEGCGRYKFPAKKKKDGRIEWAHFMQRDNGLKEKVYRGEVGSQKELDVVLEIMNNNLSGIFGKHAEMKQGIPEFRSLMGTKFDDSIK